MQVIPAVDILEGRCVRLTKGDFAARTDYGEPLECAQRWQREGAELLHVVDLDGARSGVIKNITQIGRILKLGIPCQVGGGIRSEADAKRMLELGASRIVLGTAAIKEQGIAKRLSAEFGSERIVLAVDARGSRVALSGWAEGSQLDACEIAKKAKQLGAGRVLFTAISRDGTMKGPDVAAIARIVAAARVPVIASGGIATLADVRAVAAAGAEALIIGKALYEGAFTLADATAAAGK
jgi:phosphoribosylformimino-5-aminoimidazole carboxamide ribotide isomerase